MNAAQREERLDLDELRDAWPALDADERAEGFRLLGRDDASELYESLRPLAQAQILVRLPRPERRVWLRLLAPDDAADALQEVEQEQRGELLEMLDGPTRREVNALMAYAEDDAGGLMSPRFARVRPDMSTDEAIRYLQRQAREKLETIYYVYVLDAGQHLLGVCSFRELFMARPDQPVRQIMHSDPVVVTEAMDQEAVARIAQQGDFLALPVVDDENRMKGIVTLDDIVDVVQEEATEDAQKFGGMEALDAPYWQASLGHMVRKRAGWLAILFVGEMFTASAMSGFQNEIAQAVVLTLFMPLIISSGGNSGSQASTLIIRAMALGEIKLRDWLRILGRELRAGVLLGIILAGIGVVRIVVWEAIFHSYGAHTGLLAITVGLALIGVVTWGTLTGSMLPFVLRRFGLDPASASAPFVATLVDVVGLVIYFEVARVVLGGALG